VIGNFRFSNQALVRLSNSSEILFHESLALFLFPSGRAGEETTKQSDIPKSSSRPFAFFPIATIRALGNRFNWASRYRFPQNLVIDTGIRPVSVFAEHKTEFVIHTLRN